MSDEPGSALTLQELPELRRKTEAVSRFLRDQIAAHLETLRPMFAAERIFGKYAGGKVDVTGAERALTDMQQSYNKFTRPYDLPEIFEANWLTLVGNAPELHPWEYAQQVKGQAVTIASPVRWAVNYRANFSLNQVKSALAAKEPTRADSFRQFVVNALVLQIVLNRTPGLTQLFRDLRYELKTETPAELKGLPILTITSTLTSFRPADDLIAAAIAFSGVPSFIELLDLQAINQSADPFRSKLDALLK